ncbi:MAG: UDP-N-acetylmuramoyl-tripeptide--D-alanyl-D-alanine ligase [Spirochaetota bacterium]
MDRLFSVREAAEMAQCTLVYEGRAVHSAFVSGVATDSRMVGRNFLFVALKGERTDGHRFIHQAVENGAAAVLIAHSYTQTPEYRDNLHDVEIPILTHENPLRALQLLASAYINEFPQLLKIGITGSNGKTTTKELLAAILAEVAATVKNEGNLNSDIGLPLSVFKVRERHHFGVFEMGINHVGEMQTMVDVLRPLYGVITNIGTAHIGLLGSREGIAREKGSLFSSLPADGIGFVPDTFEWREYYTRICRAPLVPFGTEATVGVHKTINHHLNGWTIAYENEQIRFRLPGVHNLNNAMAAIQVARTLGARPEQIKAGLEKHEILQGRSQVIEGAITIVQDSYNANAESVIAILSTLQDAAAGRLVVVLGAMKELGDKAESSHRKVGSAIANMNAAAVFLFGEEMEYAYQEALQQGFQGVLKHSNDFKELSRLVAESVQARDTVLLKGSRSMELERLVPELEQKFNTQQGNS